MAKSGEWGMAAAAFLLGTVALYQGLVVRKYALTTKKWARGRALRFVVLADLHFSCFGEGQRDLLHTVDEQRPDFILFPGDIVDERIHPRRARQLLRGAAELAPCYYAPGNHEYRIHRLPEVMAMVKRCGVTVLADQYRQLHTTAGPLIIAGCEDPEKSKGVDPHYTQAQAVKAAFAPLAGTEAYTVLLAHRPEAGTLYRQLPFDLVVSGHAHGGQVRLPPLLNGLYAPEQGLFPKVVGGCYHCEEMRHVVSRGVAVFKNIPRVFNPPEVVVVDVAGSGGV